MIVWEGGAGMLMLESWGCLGVEMPLPFTEGCCWLAHARTWWIRKINRQLLDQVAACDKAHCSAGEQQALQTARVEKRPEPLGQVIEQRGQIGHCDVWIEHRLTECTAVCRLSGPPLS